MRLVTFTNGGRVTILIALILAALGARAEAATILAPPRPPPIFDPNPWRAPVVIAPSDQYRWNSVPDWVARPAPGPYWPHPLTLGRPSMAPPQFLRLPGIPPRVHALPPSRPHAAEVGSYAWPRQRSVIPGRLPFDPRRAIDSRLPAHLPTHFDRGPQFVVR